MVGAMVFAVGLAVVALLIFAMGRDRRHRSTLHATRDDCAFGDCGWDHMRTGLPRFGEEDQP